MQRRRDAPLIPHNPAPYLGEWLFDIGPVSQGPLGEGSITYSELTAWMTITGIAITAWEARALRAMSAAYAAERQLGRKRDHPAPFTGEDLTDTRDAVTKKINAIFRKK